MKLSFVAILLVVLPRWLAASSEGLEELLHKASVLQTPQVGHSALRATAKTVDPSPHDAVTDQLLESTGETLVQLLAHHSTPLNLLDSALPGNSDVSNEGTSSGAVPLTTSTSSHYVQWGSDLTGCNLTQPINVTISCGSGGTLTIVQQYPAVQGCVKKSANTQVCTSVKAPSSISTVVAICSGTTVAQLTATVRLPVTKAKCAAVTGGTANDFVFLGRVCQGSSGDIAVKYNYNCLSGTKGLAGSNSYCYSKSTCKSTSSCTTSVGTVALSDPELLSSSCINKGPKLTSVSYALHDVYWISVSKTCQLAANTVNINCQKGGTIQVIAKSPEVTQCTKTGTSNLVCTKQAGQSTAWVTFACNGRTAAQLIGGAVLPQRVASQCTFAGTNNASQALLMEHYCGPIKNASTYISSSCGTRSQLFINDEGTPACIAGSHCSGVGCSATVKSVSQSDPFIDPNCVYLQI